MKNQILMLRSEAIESQYCSVVKLLVGLLAIRYRLYLFYVFNQDIFYKL